MPNALFAFDDRDAAHRALQRLREAGFPPALLHLHERDAGTRAETAREVDEQVRGGFVTNLLDLFQGLFEWGSSPHDASAFADTVRRGGAVVSVDAADDAQCSLAEQAAQAEGCSVRTGWSTQPTR